MAKEGIGANGGVELARRVDRSTDHFAANDLLGLGGVQFDDVVAALFFHLMPFLVSLPEILAIASLGGASGRGGRATAKRVEASERIIGVGQRMACSACGIGACPTNDLLGLLVVQLNDLVRVALVRIVDHATPFP